jgi:serine/threonine protein phosphatase PrpC
MHFAYKVAKTDNVIIFDGAMGGINVSQSLAELLVRKAPEVSARVDRELMPRWLKQRGVAGQAAQCELAAAR